MNDQDRTPECLENQPIPPSAKIFADHSAGLPAVNQKAEKVRSG
jgi:hypothetical protein